MLGMDPIILFFILGLLASWFRSDLEIPPSLSKMFSIYLLLSLGLKGGYEVSTAKDLSEFYVIALIGILSCILICYYFFIGFKSILGSANASALAACYGSVSAITFITAQNYLDNHGVAYSGFMVAVMAIMEIPAIILALYLYKKNPSTDLVLKASKATSVFASKSVILLLGGFLIGMALNESSWNSVAPVVQGAFKGVLIFFLLDLGLAAQKQMRDFWKHKVSGLVIACLLPLLNGCVVLILAQWINVGNGNKILLAVLAGSASYIAAPAAIRSSIVDANPSLYVSLPLAITFSMNVMFGIPFYVLLSKLLNRSNLF